MQKARWYMFQSPVNRGKSSNELIALLAEKVGDESVSIPCKSGQVFKLAALPVYCTAVPSSFNPL